MGKNNRNRRRGPGKGPAQQQPASANGADRYQKYLPAWMKDNASGQQPARPQRPRRARPARPAGGYTPGKAAVHESRFET
ncbi:MAG: hypothetical protein WD359_06115 [Dehalococcoidia bacterium]